MRIVPDELWSPAKERQTHTRRAIAATGKPGTANRPRYLFSGLTKCGVCGAGFIIGSANRLMCFGARDQGTCSNRLTIRRDEVEQRVLHALQGKLLRQDLFEEFCEEFTREMNRLRMEYRANLSSAEGELERVRASIGKIIDAIKAGFAGPELKAEMDELQVRKESLLARLATADAPMPLLHSTWQLCTARRSPRWRRPSRTQTAVLRPQKCFGASWTPSSSCRPATSSESN